MALVCPWSPFLAVAASLRQPLMQQPSAAQPRLLTALVPLVATTITVLLAVAALPGLAAMVAVLAGLCWQRTRPPCCAGAARLQVWARIAPWPRFRDKAWQTCRRRLHPACPLVLSLATSRGAATTNITSTSPNRVLNRGLPSLCLAAQLAP